MAVAQEWQTSGTSIYNTNSGNVGIGTSSPEQKLDVSGALKISGPIVGTPNGLILSSEIGFKSIQSYNNESLYINRLGNNTLFNINGGSVGIGTNSPSSKKNGHLPEIPSEAEVTENGINLGEMNAKLLQKIEELTPYMIEMNKQMKSQNERVEQLEAQNAELKNKIQLIENQ